jgi:phosphoribosylamine--glycine ligase
MKILVIGSGGREHALVWKISQSPLVAKIYAAPGNPGISQLAECLPIPQTDITSLKTFALKEKIDLTLVGPEAPLCAGIVDEFQKEGLKIFGPTKSASELEASKAFTKELLKRSGIPTASYKIVSSFREGLEYLKKTDVPIVLKVDGLASGKGVFVCTQRSIAERHLSQIMKERIFGTAGDKVVIEEYLTGKEVSVLSLVDGKTIAVLEPVCDYKRLLDNDLGPNTGGMGSFSHVLFITPGIMEQIAREIFVPVVHAMNTLERPYQGVLYAGLILSPGGLKVLEFNVRFGDPETQPLMMRLKTDLVPLLLAVVEKNLDRIQPIEWSDEAAVCVVMTAKGYPSNPKIGDVIEITQEDQRTGNDIQIFHAGTRLDNGRLITAGGRVLGITAKGKDHSEARKKVYDTITEISFDGAFYRRDIANKL